MANTKQFTDLPAVTSLADGDILPIQTVAGETSKITKANLKATLGSQGITAVVEDTTPKLGGDLDADNKDITNLGTVNTHTIPAGTGTIALTTDIPDVSGFITDISNQDLSTADNATSQFITSADIPASIAEVVEDTSPQLGGDLDGQSTYKIENIVSVNGITITEGAGTLTLNDNTLSVTGADVIINASDEATITFPETTGTILVDDDTTVTIPNATTITSTANGDVYTLPTATGTLALTDDIPTDLSDLTDTNNLLTTSETIINPEPSADSYSGLTISLDASEDFAIGEIGYIDASGTVTRADASALTTSGALVMALEVIDQSAEPTGKFLLQGTFHADTLAPNWTIGGIVYLSETVGDMTQTKPTTANSVTQILGVALSADVLLFKPELVMVEHA